MLRLYIPVRSFGSETRRTDEFIPPLDFTVPFIAFRGKDIAEIDVLDVTEVDPAMKQKQTPVAAQTPAAAVVPQQQQVPRVLRHQEVRPDELLDPEKGVQFRLSPECRQK